MKNIIQTIGDLIGLTLMLAMWVFLYITLVPLQG